MKKDNMKLIAGILLFGSLWGFSEVIIGSSLNEAGFLSGGVMTGLIAISFLVMSRIYYKRPGMQLGMGLVAGSLRLFNPFAGCHLCSALAIMAEGIIFELIWYNFSIEFKELKNLTMQTSIGILTAYLVYIGGYIITQILTPIVSGTGFYLENLIVFMPRILASGLLPALIGGFTSILIIQSSKLDFKLKDTLYYPTTVGLSVFCWIFIIGTWFMLGA
jgi:hypothetical protein